MKKLLLSLACIFFTFYYSNAQVIDIVGQGVLGQTNPIITLTDISNIDHVEVNAVSKGLYAAVPPNGVLFDNTDTPSSDWKTVDDYNSPSYDQSVGFYYRTFNSLIDEDLHATITIENYIHSFFAYVHRDITNATYQSFLNTKTAFMFHNGSSDPIVYDIAINSASAARNITVKIPISELDDRERMVDITIEAGSSISYHTVENTWNRGNSLLLGTYLLENVPGDVTNVKVTIYSPNSKDDQLDGDSFFVGGIVVDVDKVYDGCTLTQGYWKTHSSCKSNGNGNGKGPKRDDTWDQLPEAEETIFFLSEQNYCEVFDTKPGKEGKYYILAHQYIAAQLNILAGADPSAIADAFTDATTFLETYTPKDVKGDATLEAQCVYLGGILADFNEGKIGPGHCDEEEKEYEPVKQQRSKQSVAIYPNPAVSYGKMTFTPKQSGKTTVDLFNVSGQKVGTIFNEQLKKGTPFTFEFETDQLKKGLYFVIIKNGSDVYKEKISVIK